MPIHQECAVYRDQDPRTYPAPYQMSHAALQATGGNTGIRQANEHIDRLAQDAFRPLTFDGATRWQNFSLAVSNCARRGVGVGARVGRATMAIPDAVLGTGVPTGPRVKYDPRAEGLVGLAAHAAIDATSTVAMAPGAAIGAFAGTASYPIAYGVALRDDGRPGRFEDCYGADTMRFGAYVPSVARHGADDVGTAVAAPVAGSVGVALGVTRIPSVVVKYTLAGVGGFIGAVCGLFVGAGRAIFKK